jgi:cellulose synthase/poly-beta-1,6-N-acetylglucosamine synthase-like glycosyltransferase
VTTMLSSVAVYLAWALALAAALPLSILSLEVLAGLMPMRATTKPASWRRCVILIPAHNEAAGIATTLQKLNAIAPDNIETLVVADNCSDETAAIARELGAIVIERADNAKRGKGYALAFGRDYLAQSGPSQKTADTCAAPEVVIILDADCELHPGSIEALIGACLQTPVAPAQAVNLILPDRDASPLIQISGFAMVVKNLFRSRGMQRLGGGALLTGTGMAFPWSIFETAELSTGSIVEDLGLGINLTQAGYPPRLISAAQVRSAPASADAARVQRTRWEHGFLSVFRQAALTLISTGIRRASLPSLLLGLHLAVPPLAMLMLLVMLIFIVLSVLAVFSGNIAPLIFLGGATLVATGSLFAAWIAGGRAWLAGSALIRIPFYILWKLPIYAGFIRKRETGWQRTPRQP